jgi:hypothetical protein
MILMIISIKDAVKSNLICQIEHIRLGKLESRRPFSLLNTVDGGFFLVRCRDRVR